MDIKRIIYGRSTMAQSWIHEDGADNIRLPIDFAFFLLRVDGRTILVDAGCDTMSGFIMEDFIGPVEALRREGIAAQEITDVIITHSHHDHMAGIRHFPTAHVYLHRLEFEKGQKYLQPGQPYTLFDDTLMPFPDVRIVHIGGHCAGSSVVELGDTVLCGDECYGRYNLNAQVPSPKARDKVRSQYFIDRYSRGWNALLCHQP